MIEIELNMGEESPRKVTFPTSWAELTMAQVKVLADLIVMERYTPHELRIRWAASLLGFPFVAMAGACVLVSDDLTGSKTYRIDAAMITPLTAVLDFAFQTTAKGAEQIRTDLTIAPEFDMLKGPAPLLADILFEQYQELMIQLSILSNRPADRASVLRRIGGILYRPCGESWDSNRVEWYASYVSQYMTESDYLSLLWYINGSMTVLAGHFPRVLGGESEPGGNLFDSQMRTLDALTDGDVTKRPGIRCANLIDVLSNMDIKLERSEREKQR